MAFNVYKNKSIIVRKMSLESEVGDLILGNISIEYCSSEKRLHSLIL